jgi:hypothetical protein
VNTNSARDVTRSRGIGKTYRKGLCVAKVQAEGKEKFARHLWLDSAAEDRPLSLDDGDILPSLSCALSADSRAAEDD